MRRLAIVSMIAGNARPTYQRFIGPLVATFCIAPQFALGDLSPSDVLVLYNAEDADSTDIANYYAQKRPGVRLFGLTGVTAEEEVSASDYLSNIRPQVLSALDDSIDVIVTTKGLPLRIRVAQSNPGSYTDPSGTSRSIGPWSWKRYSSLESELTRIDSISMWQQMGDQSTSFTPSPVVAVNPYYWQTTAFESSRYGIRLASRLDGFTVADVHGMIDRAGNAFIAPGGAVDPFHFVIDDDPDAPGSTADNMERLKDFVMQPRNLSYTYDAGNDFIREAATNHADASLVVGYVSHGVHGGAPVDYLSNPETGIQFPLANGAVFASWESYNAKTFSPDVSVSQGLVAQWIARGGTAGIGHVAEPYASSFTVAREDGLFDRLLGGMSWVEAAWSSTYQLSYVNTVVGDPLMRFRQWLPGDLNMNGRVDVGDSGVLRSNFYLPPGNLTWLDGDLTGDGDVNIEDLNVLLSNYYKTPLPIQPNSKASGAATPIPEPVPATLVCIAAFAALALRWNGRLTS